MVYEVDTTPFDRLKEMVSELPSELLSNPQAYKGILFAYVDTFGCLLSLLKAIMLTCGKSPKTHRYIYVFLPIYDQLQERILELLRAEISEGIKERSTYLIEFVEHVIRDSQVTLELTALDTYISQSAGSVDPDEHLDKTITVINNLTKQIKNHTNQNFIKRALQTLDDLISTINRAL